MTDNAIQIGFRKKKLKTKTNNSVSNLMSPDSVTDLMNEPKVSIIGETKSLNES